MAASAVSKAIGRGQLVYVHALPPQPSSDVGAETRGALDEVDRLLAQAGTNKAKVLTAQVRLRNMELAEAHDAVWQQWIDPRNPPLVTRVQAELSGPHRIELMLTATR